MKLNLANKLTVFRILLVPIMVIIPYLGLKGEYLGIPITMLIMEAIYIIASITDKLDGYIARSRNEITTFGKFLDPIADKILTVIFLMTGCLESVLISNDSIGLDSAPTNSNAKIFIFWGSIFSDIYVYSNMSNNSISPEFCLINLGIFTNSVLI